MPSPLPPLLPLLLLLPLLIAQKDCDSPTPTETPTPEGACDDALWHKTWGSPELEEAWGVGLSPSGDVYVSMHRANPAQTDAFIVKTTSHTFP